MEPRVAELLKAHHEDRDLTSEKDIAGLDWSWADLSGWNLTGVALSTLQASATLEGARFINTCLEGADLSGAVASNAKFSQSQMRGARLEGAMLQSAEFHGTELEHAKLDGAYLEGADFSNADLSHVRYEGGDLMNAKLNNARLEGVHFTHLNLSRANLADMHARGASFDHCDFSKARLIESDLAETLFEHCNLQQAQLQGASLARAKINDCHFREARMKGANLVGCRARECNFDRTNLTNALLVEADLRGDSLVDAVLDGAALDHADLRQANLEGTDLRNTGLNRTDLRQARLHRTVFTGSEIEYALIDEVSPHETEGEYELARENYRIFKNVFRTNGCHERASYCSYRESVMTRKQFHQDRKYFWWFSYIMGDILFGYGEKLSRVALSALGVILIFSLIYWAAGDNIVHEGNHDPSLRECFYLSGVTFTSLGYGDITPTGYYQVLAVVEALMGVSLMSLFVVTLSRKLIT